MAIRGMIVDFAMLSGMWAGKDDILPIASLCSIRCVLFRLDEFILSRWACSSNVCRLTAVGLGWERAFGVVDQMGYADEKKKEMGRCRPKRLNHTHLRTLCTVLTSWNAVNASGQHTSVLRLGRADPRENHGESAH